MEIPEHVIHILPVISFLPKNKAMTTIFVSSQPRIILNDMGPQRIEMDVPNQFRKIRLFLAKYGFIPVLEKLSMATMSMVKGHSITGQNPAHDSG